MRKAGRLTAQARALAGSMVAPGVTTHEIDTAVRRFIESHGGKPSFLGYAGFPGSACISVNEVVIHGIPGPRKLKEGDIVSVDVGAYIDGFHGDCAATYACGEISDQEIEDRMGGRRVCSKCGASYHLKARPTKVEGVCDACGAPVVQRADDKPVTVRERLRVYHEQTEPLKDYYQSQGTLRSVDNQPTIEATTAVILEALESRRASTRLP